MMDANVSVVFTKSGQETYFHVEPKEMLEKGASIITNS